MKGPTRPALRYHGGKWRLAPWIIGHFPAHRVYVEPYGGGASVLLRKPRSYAEVYNDTFGDVVTFFRVLRDPELARKLQELIELTPYARSEFDEAAEPSNDPVEIARRLLIRSYMGFGSLRTRQDQTGFRSDTRRSHRTPCDNWVTWPMVVPDLTARLKGVVIESRPAAEIITSFDSPETLFYVDPPYLHSTRSRRNPYCAKHMYACEMNDEDHVALGIALRSAKGFVVLSGYESQLYAELFGDWRRLLRDAHADGARDRTECLWLNPACAAALGGQLDLQDGAA